MNGNHTRVRSKNQFFLEQTLVIPYRNYVFKGTNLKTDVFRFDSYLQIFYDTFKLKKRGGAVCLNENVSL